MRENKTTFQFISVPSDINFGGNVHGGSIMKWIDQAGYACAAQWSGTYCITVYISGIRFIKPIKIGQLVKVEATVIHTGNTSIHISIDVFARDVTKTEFEKKTHCTIVFVAVDENGNKVNIPKWIPQTESEKKLEEYAKKIIEFSKDIDTEIKPYLP